MKISKSKDGEKIIVELDFWQKESNCYMDDKDLRDVSNLIGIIAGDEKTISQLNDLNYKDSQQEGGPLVHFYGDEKEFRDICFDIGIDVWEYDLCDSCHEPIRGTFTFNDKGKCCYDCELKCETKQK